MFTEQDDTSARRRALLTVRACWRAVRQLRHEHASVLGLARQLGTSWKTVWRAIRPLLGVMDAGPARFDGVEILGQRARLGRAIAADERHDEVSIAWQAAQELRSALRQQDPAQGLRIAERVLASFPSCPIPEISRLGRTLQKWREAFLAYVNTAGASNGGTEVVNGLELHRRVARGFRNIDNYRLRMLLIGGGLSDPRLL